MTKAGKEEQKPGLLTTHERVEIFRQQIQYAVKNDLDFSAELPYEVFGMAFATSAYLMYRLYNQSRSPVFIPEEEGVKIVIVRPLADQLNLAKAMFEPNYRTSLVAGWIEKLYRALQNPDYDASATSTHDVIEKSMQGLGISETEKIQMPGMFDLQYPDKSHPVQQLLSQMRKMGHRKDMLYAPEGSRNYINDLWDILGFIDHEKQQSIKNFDPKNIPIPGGPQHQDI